MSEKVAPVQRKTQNDLEKTWRTIRRNTFFSLEAKYKETKSASSLLNSTMSYGAL